MSGKNEPGEQDTIISGVFLPPHLSNHQLNHICYKCFSLNFEEHAKGAVLYPYQHEAAPNSMCGIRTQGAEEVMR